MRTIDPILSAAMAKGDGMPIARAEIYDEVGGALLYTYDVISYKLEHLKATVILPADSYIGAIIILKRGLQVAKTEYLISSPRLFVQSWIILPNSTIELSCSMFPRTNYATSVLDTPVSTVLTNLAAGQITPSTDPLELWHTWDFERAGTSISVSNFNVLLGLLFQKYFVQPFPRDDGVIHFLSPSILYYKTPTTVALTYYRRFLAAIGYYLVWVDEAGTPHYTGNSQHKKHNLGFIESTVPSLDVAKLLTAWPGRHYFTQPGRPNLALENGDFVYIETIAGGIPIQGIITIEEEFKRGQPPHWSQVIRTFEFLPFNTTIGVESGDLSRVPYISAVDTKNFDWILSINENTLQAALDSLDDHTHLSVLTNPPSDPITGKSFVLDISGLFAYIWSGTDWYKVPVTPPPGSLLLEDGSSFLLLEDAISHILTE